MAKPKPRQVQVRTASGKRVPAISGPAAIQTLVGDLIDFKSTVPEEYDGERQTTKVPKELLRALEVIRHAEGSPHQTAGDQIRDAILAWVTAYHELEKRGDPRVTAWLHHSRIQMETAWLERHQQEVYTATHRLTDHVLMAVGKGRFDQAFRAISGHWREVRRIQDTDWQEDYVDAMKAEGSLVMVITLLNKLGYKIPREMKGAVK
jgi:hypothetical protein